MTSQPTVVRSSAGGMPTRSAPGSATARPTSITQATAEDAPTIRVVRDDAIVAAAHSSAAPRPPRTGSIGPSVDGAGRGHRHVAIPDLRTMAAERRHLHDGRTWRILWTTHGTSGWRSPTY